MLLTSIQNNCEYNSCLNVMVLNYRLSSHFLYLITYSLAYHLLYHIFLIGIFHIMYLNFVSANNGEQGCNVSKKNKQNNRKLSFNV